MNYYSRRTLIKIRVTAKQYLLKTERRNPMKRLTGAVDKNGNFVVGKIPKTSRHPGYKEENREMQRLTHSAELVQAFHPDGTRNTAYRSEERRVGKECRS